MTTDDFTTAAMHAAEQHARWTDEQIAFVAGAEWAHAHLAEQEPTDAEVEAAARALAYWDGVTDWDSPVWTGEIHQGAYLVGARKALTAAREARP